MIALILSALFLMACNSGKANPTKRELNLYVWSQYIPDTVLKEFENKTQIRIRYDTYDSNEALLEKMQSGVAAYDVIVPSDYMLRILRNQSLIERLDHKRLPNLKNVHPRFLDLPYDSGNRYSAPFLWSTTGIGYNKSKVSETVDSWSILWKPEYRERVLMLDDMRECFAAALKWKGHSLNSRDPAHLREARDLLAMQKPLVKTYNSAAPEEVLLSGDVWLAQIWSGTMVLAMDQDPNLAYVIPKEGAALAVENFAIPVNAEHRDEAYEFINFCLDARTGAEITNWNRYPNTNEAARQFLRPEIRNNPVIYPDDETLSRCELFDDPGEAYPIIDRYWTEIKSR